MKKFFINENDSGQRVDKFVSKALPELPKSMMYKLFRKKDIKINGKRCDISAMLNAGDELTIYVKDDVAAERKKDLGFLNVPVTLSIVYEDSNIIVVDKPAGLDSHSGSTFSDNLVDRIRHYLYNKGEFSPDAESSFAPSVCSRLDRNTCGLVTAAKNSAALREINAAIRNGQMLKVYHCITAAPLPEKNAVLTAYHKKEESRNLVKISDTPLDGYKIIKTGYDVLAVKGSLSLVEVTLYTGRTHQIRAHLAHIGAPVLGDGKYGNIAANKRYGIFHQALCACGVSFRLDEDSPLAYLNEVKICAPAPDFERKYFGAQLG